ncbi:hypothetical protein EDC04DRAFT_3090249 [Pisolithus marmoratus]|nr:hypothetical protein EDC04DRAFT_3090249 [Pisolithus marmoratus]
MGVLLPQVLMGDPLPQVLVAAKLFSSLNDGMTLRKRRVSYWTTTTFCIHQPVMMAFLLKVSSIHKAVVVLYLLMKKIEQLRVWFETISNKLKNITIKTISPVLQILNVYIMFINSSSLIAQLHSNKMCCWMNIHLQLLPNKFQLLCGAASDSFPSRAWFIDEKSALYITKAMAEHEQTSMLIPCGYWPDYHKDLGILLWEALMMWQSTLKAKAHEYVVQHYPLGGNQLAEENLANAQELIWGVQFMRDGIEEDVCYYILGTTCNMASPALTGLIIDFFYATPSALSNLFPEVFAQEAPKPVVCLAVMALQAAIDDTYSKVFVQLMAMQTKIDGNCKHTAMTWTLRIGWATTGRVSLGGKMAIASEDDFEVVLN